MYHFGDSWAAEAVALRMKTIRNRQGDADTVPHSAWKLQLFHSTAQITLVAVVSFCFQHIRFLLLLFPYIPHQVHNL